MIGILSLQGDYSTHHNALQKLEIDCKLIRLPQHLENCQGLIIPGGESSALLKLMAPLDFLSDIHNFYTNGGAIFGTCAGMILLAKHVVPEQKSLGLLDIDVERNSYGRQLQSCTRTASKTSPVFGKQPLPMTLIRAPRITRVSNNVKILAWDNSTPMLVQQDRLLAASFHPELGFDNPDYDSRVLEYFSDLVNTKS